MIWLSLDPGLLNCGYCVGSYQQGVIGRPEVNVIKGGCLHQPKAPKKRNIKSAADDFDRSAKLTQKLWNLVETWEPMVMCMESMSLPRNSSTAGKLGRGYGAIAAVAALSNTAVISVSPQEVKESLLGRRSGTKSDIAGALLKIYGTDTMENVLGSGVTKELFEHPVDALAVLHASIDTALFKLGSKEL